VSNHPQFADQQRAINRTDLLVEHLLQERLHPFAVYVG
jgi:hypothetical protein